MHARDELPARTRHELGLTDSDDQPLVIAFFAGPALRESPILDRVRAELRGLGAGLLLLSEGRRFSFQPDDELDLHGRSDHFGAEARANLRQRCGLSPTPARPDELALVVTIGTGVIVARQTVRAEDGLTALADALQAAGREAIARHSSRLSRRDIVLASLVGTLALLATEGCRSNSKPTPSVVPSSVNAARTRKISLNVNGQVHLLEVEPRVSLLDALRERLGFTGSKKGCDHGQCGACTVLVAGRRVNACLTLAVMVGDAPITTIEGLSLGDTLHPMQAAFVHEDALQCGYCTPGQIMSALGLVRENRAHTDAEVREQMSGNICRCGAYPNIVAAIQSGRAGSTTG